MNGNEINCEPIHASVIGGELTRDECKVLASVMDSQQLEDGETLVSEGDENTTDCFMSISLMTTSLPVPVSNRQTGGHQGYRHETICRLYDAER